MTTTRTAALALALAASTALLASTTTLPGCETEDGSRADAKRIDCRWDASTAGNGRGDSFTVHFAADGSIEYRYDNGTIEVAR